jgi:hypothetical protein
MSLEASQRAYELIDLAIQCRESDPDLAIVYLEQGRPLAEKLDDPCLLMRYDKWMGNVLLYYRGDYRKALDYLVRATVEARKPRYVRCNERNSVLRLLADAYLYQDPIGYADQIRQTNDMMERELNLHHDLWCLVQWARAYLELIRGDLDAALSESMVYMERCEQSYSDFRLADAHALLCEVYFYRGEVDEIRRYAESGEAYAQDRHDTQGWHLEMIAWQAYCAQHRADLVESRRLHQKTLLILARMKATPSIPFYTALCHYHELRGELALALEWRDRQLNEVVNTGSPYVISEVRLERLKLKRQLGLDLAEELAATRTIAAQLIKPDYFYARLKQVIER